jgi:hypothetical protein
MIRKKIKSTQLQKSIVHRNNTHDREQSVSELLNYWGVEHKELSLAEKMTLVSNTLFKKYKNADVHAELNAKAGCSSYTLYWEGVFDKNRVYADNFGIKPVKVHLDLGSFIQFGGCYIKKCNHPTDISHAVVIVNYVDKYDFATWLDAIQFIDNNFQYEPCGITRYQDSISECNLKLMQHNFLIELTKAILNPASNMLISNSVHLRLNLDIDYEYAKLKEFYNNHLRENKASIWNKELKLEFEDEDEDEVIEDTHEVNLTYFKTIEHWSDKSIYWRQYNEMAENLIERIDYEINYAAKAWHGEGG